ncbi:2-succinyl-5-enolpyruvyl-6-hydroxy-3-cyclohexene-1-carboxylic-acid synthase [Knoellia subterranea]|uniref:2-succinyl-5-enolpyruvyl-6-hydroxy-3-cyclohexene-1-carboxylate synthase n=1 Tax=Knoellia subterranea KCTC 19937 TaxID=1385521 RepID=A0A0A0JRI8_9MICO|nr:2-succinyl-5-enolpyruvyl-6-hydroxy-3-cyclohexene-1-carboxylic-acid synthase [Knoellia subterranea]KGN38216.1 2-succinyl-5-enolpyruvyl-6-hydroxy-3-cyclohexene-1-carboxylate synthase [Knoellia subterranea KCTC 19937]
MRPSTALATVLVDELIRGGVREVVLAPGSRSAPLAYAVQQAEREGRLRLHVRVDERTAGFLALGLAKGSRTPVPVITTSGTAVANLHPAVLEAHHTGVPLVVLSADRPAELRGTGANQTTVQPGMFGGAVRWSADLPAPELVESVGAFHRSTVCRALVAARGTAADGRPGPDAGPVHLNVSFRDPLTPDLGDASDVHAGRADGEPWVRSPLGGWFGESSTGGVAHVPRTLVVLGDLSRSPVSSAQVVEWAVSRGYPVVAEPFGVHDRTAVVPHGPLLLTAGDWLAAHVPERVLVVGRITLSRAVAALLRTKGLRVEVFTGAPQWPDPGHVVHEVHPLMTFAGESPDAPDRQWLQGWVGAGSVVAQAVRGQSAPWGTGLAVASVVGESLPEGAQLFVGSSNPVRDLDLGMSRESAISVVANRGLAGIDGCLSTAIGLALTTDAPSYAWVGDLTFLHDSNALAIGPDEPRPDLTILVGNDGGGGIFRTLEHGAPERADDFTRIFGTPTGTDIGALCRAHGIRHLVADSREAAADALSARPEGITVVEVPLDPESHRAAHEGLRDLAREALAISG